ncbi:MAG: cation:proton antiporter [Halioglobus sp.]
MMYENMAILAGFVFFYSVVSGGLERTPINGALVFVLFGLMVGPLGLDWLQLSLDSEGLRVLAEITLALVLFTDAAGADLGVLRQRIVLPRRLLLVGLPLTILLGFGAGAFLFDSLGLFEVAILATMLAPTDAALGKAVVTNASVPDDLRQGLNVESGLNDGICVPILFVFLALAQGQSGDNGTMMLALELVVEEIGIGLAVGLTVTAIGSVLVKTLGARGYMTKSWRQLPVVALATVCFATAQLLGGSGFIAAFAGGMLFGWIVQEHKKKLLLAAEGTGDTTSLLTWVAFGAIVVGTSFDALTWQVVVYSLLSLTVVRMLPVFLSLYSTHLRVDEKLFAAWFGPRGLASIVFGVIVLNADLPGGDIIGMTVLCTVFLSVVCHGVSANPLVAVLAARLKRSGQSATADKQA